MSFHPRPSGGLMFENQVAFVTGAGSGIGRATVHRFLSEGARAVFAVDLTEDGLRETQSTASRPDKVRIRIVDVSQEDSVKQALESCVQEFGRIDCAFANAGIVGDMVPFWSSDAETWGSVLDVNVRGVFYVFKHASRLMLQGQESDSKGLQDRSLIATASVAGLRSGAGGSAYSASKAAVVNLCQTVACQLAGTGIRCNAICPGVIETGMTKPMFDLADARKTRGKIGQLNPLQRGAQPVEVATVATFLASRDASYINGQAIVVDGGLSSSHPFVPRSGGKPSL